MHQVQLCLFGCADALTSMDDDNIKVGSSSFDNSDNDPQNLQAVHRAWVSLITTCKEATFVIFQGAEPPGVAWSRRVLEYHASDLKE